MGECPEGSRGGAGQVEEEGLHEDYNMQCSMTRMDTSRARMPAMVLLIRISAVNQLLVLRVAIDLVLEVELQVLGEPAAARPKTLPASTPGPSQPLAGRTPQLRDGNMSKTLRPRRPSRSGAATKSQQPSAPKEAWMELPSTWQTKPS